jgi:hypothetical protein
MLFLDYRLCHLYNLLSKDNTLSAGCSSEYKFFMGNSLPSQIAAAHHAASSGA